jgi:hypothetical protein
VIQYNDFVKHLSRELIRVSAYSPNEIPFYDYVKEYLDMEHTPNSRCIMVWMFNHFELRNRMAGK